MEEYGRSWKLVECSVSVTIYHHVWPGGGSKLVEFSPSGSQAKKNNANYLVYSNLIQF